MSWNPERSPGGLPPGDELSRPTKVVLVGALLMLVLFASQMPSPSVAVDAGSIPGTDGSSITPGIVLSALPESPPLDVQDDDATAVDATTIETFAASESSQAIDTLLADEPGIYGVQLIMADGTLGFSRNADTPFVSASLYKLVLIADVYSGIAEGSVRSDLELTLLPEYFPVDGDFEDSVYTVADHNAVISIEQLLYVTGAYSSNVAAQALLSITDVESLERTAADLGMINTRFFVDPSELESLPKADTSDKTADQVQEALEFVTSIAGDELVNITTPRDVAEFFSELLDGTVVNQATSAKIIDILLDQAVTDRFPELLPEDTNIAHKTGNLDHVVHDVGIIWTVDGPVILVAMVEGAEDDTHATEIIQQLAMIAYGEIPSGAPEVITLE